ncbi:MAG: hypothetical protein CM15mP46_7070 [Alphaproteobacteria bacterium]|nr:MAG: hypothetical protein CM15mP46_7070 [Alphaproteobacteria bacterium]
MKQAGLQWAELQARQFYYCPSGKAPDGTSAWLKNNSWIVGWHDAVDKYDGLVSLQRLPHSLTHERRFRGTDLLAADPIKLAAAARIAKPNRFWLSPPRLIMREANALSMLRRACSTKLDSQSPPFQACQT